jgi:SAM-dependent methyltransferase
VIGARPRTLRQRVLLACFDALYGRLAALHELAGWAVFGAAWRARRALTLSDDAPDMGVTLDIGCGEGRLLADLRAAGVSALGVEPSAAMTRRAKTRRETVIRATAQRLPLRDGSIARVVCTYPGPWIAEPDTWAELARVTLPGASVAILLGGTTTRGRGSLVRRLISGVAYGRARTTTETILPPPLEHAHIFGTLSTVEDEWGTAYVWRGRRVAASETVMAPEAL